jgi:hypothetical protein
MNAPAREPLRMNEGEFRILTELLESERAKLLVEIRHTDHREFRDMLRHRLEVVEELAVRLRGE